MIKEKDIDIAIQIRERLASLEARVAAMGSLAEPLVSSAFCFIITAYRPDLEHFESDYKTRREHDN